MKWKDTGDMVDPEESVTEEESFDEEQYSPWSGKKGNQKPNPLLRIPVLLALLVVAIAALAGVLLMLLVGGGGGAASPQKIASLDERLAKLEERLDKFKAIDEKVTRIWEQAKSFEQFKERFERSEASTTLRMDHLTMSLETLQKQLTEARTPKAASPPPAKKGARKTAKAAKKTKATKTTKSVKTTNTVKAQYHRVQAGETLYRISRKYKLKVEQLRQMNKMKEDSVIVPGQKLIVKPASP